MKKSEVIKSFGFFYAFISNVHTRTMIPLGLLISEKVKINKKFYNGKKIKRKRPNQIRISTE